MKIRKKIGIIGGADPAASCLLYEEIIKACFQINGCKNGSEFPEIVIVSFPFTRGMSAQRAHAARQILCTELQSCVDKLVRCSVDLIALACNTLHLFMPVVNLHNKQFVHLVQTTLTQIQQAHCARVLVFATEVSMQQRLYQHPCITFIAPDTGEQQQVDHIITRVHQGIYAQTDAQLLSTITQNHDIEGVVFGCTDLSVLHKHYPIVAVGKVFDTVTILARELVMR